MKIYRVVDDNAGNGLTFFGSIADAREFAKREAAGGGAVDIEEIVIPTPITKTLVVNLANGISYAKSLRVLETWEPYGEMLDGDVYKVRRVK